MQPNYYERNNNETHTQPHVKMALIPIHSTIQKESMFWPVSGTNVTMEILWIMLISTRNIKKTNRCKIATNLNIRVIIFLFFSVKAYVFYMSMLWGWSSSRLCVYNLPNSRLQTSPHKHGQSPRRVTTNWDVINTLLHIPDSTSLLFNDSNYRVQTEQSKSWTT